VSERKTGGSASRDIGPPLQSLEFSGDHAGHTDTALEFWRVRPGRLRWLLLASAWRFDDIRQSILALLAREREAGGFRNLTPVLVGGGAALYFLAPQEPVLGVLLSSLSMAGLAAMRMTRRGATFLLLCAITLVFVGMTAAQLRTRIVGSPILAAPYTGKLTGEVIWRDFSSSGRPRYLVRPVEMENLLPGQLPKRVRLTASARHEPFRPGELLTGLANISPYSGPLTPGGYDFSFANWFQGLGGAGFFMGKPGPAEHITTDRSIWTQAEILQNRFRMELGRRIRAGLGGEQGEVAVALITGDRSGMSETVQESLRQSGLAHILAISGLHMALVTMTVFWSLRFLLAFFPPVALRYPVRKWAAASGLLASTAYLVISGASVATQRAWIMLCVMLIAIIIDRRAVTIRNVVLAATIVLILAPESFLQPGFQMSFAAAAALISAYSGLNRWRELRLNRSGDAGERRSMFSTPLIYVLGLGFTSLIAGLATAPFSAWHFHRVAPLGLVANLFAMPIVSFAVMPLALLCAILMPYGLEQVALYPLGKAIGAVADISRTVNELAPDFGTVGIMPISFLLSAALGLAVLTLFSTPLRWLGLIPVFCLPFVSDPQLPPDLIVSEDGRAVAMRDASGHLSLPYPARAKFVTGIWLRAWSSDKAGDHGTMIAQCDNDLCMAQGPSGAKFAIVYAPDAIQQACDYADILAAPRLRWIRCRNKSPAVILTRDDFDRYGTHLVRIQTASNESPHTSEGIHVTTSDGVRLEVEIATTRHYRDRPWIASVGSSSVLSQ
jgi:competence protein ComEC